MIPSHLAHVAALYIVNFFLFKQIAMFKKWVGLQEAQLSPRDRAMRRVG